VNAVALVLWDTGMFDPLYYTRWNKQLRVTQSRWPARVRRSKADAIVLSRPTQPPFITATSSTFDGGMTHQLSGRGRRPLRDRSSQLVSAIVIAI